MTVSFVNVDAFNLALSRFSRQATPEMFDKMMIKIVADLLTAVVKLTPVDTGRLRGGWQASVGQMNSADDTGNDKNGSATVGAGVSAVKNSGTMIGKTVYIYNNVFYAVYIEFGTPNMAPFGMLREALSWVQASIE